MKRSPKYKEVRLENLPEDEGPYDPPPKRIHIDYQKLIVPSRMRSSYWKYFGFPAGEDGKMITKDIIVCVLCKNQMVYNRNTSNLKMHLSSRHKTALRNVEVGDETTAGPEENKCNGNFSDHCDISNIEVVDCSHQSIADLKNEEMIISEDMYDSELSDIAIIFPSNEEMRQYEQPKGSDEFVGSFDFNEAILNFLITDLVSPKIVDGKGFRNFVSALSHNAVTLPTERMISEDLIPNLYRRFRDQVYSTILSNSSHSISLCMEQWTCLDNTLCLSIYVNYLSNDGSALNSKLLTTVCFTGTETTEQWSNFLDTVFNEWDINVNSISAVLVTFKYDELKEALKQKNLILLPCFLYLMQEICSKHCFQHPTIDRILEKCRSLIKYTQENEVDLAEDEDEFVDADADENDFVFSCDQPEMWLTTYYMLRGVLRRKQAINNSFAIKSFENSFSSSDWRLILNLLKCLEPLKTVILTLFEERTSLISLIRPLIGQVRTNKLTIDHQDVALIEDIKNNIFSAIDEAYSDKDINDFILLATQLDPRFKTFSSEDGAEIENKMMNLLNTLVEEQGLCNERSLTKRGRKPSGISVLFGDYRVDNKEEQSNEKIVNTEITSYQSESSASLVECPLQWWQNMKKKYPNLIKLAYRYHCVPAIITQANVCNLQDFITFCNQRLTLPSQIADSLLFLKINR